MDIDEKLLKQIDGLIGNHGLDSDVAKVIYPLVKDKYRYIGNSVWQYKLIENNHKEVWKKDPKADYLWKDIMVLSNHLFTKRAIDWETKNNDLKQKYLDYIHAMDNKNAALIQLEMNDNSNRSFILLKISQRFANTAYKKQLLEELKTYFCIES